MTHYQFNMDTIETCKREKSVCGGVSYCPAPTISVMKLSEYTLSFCVIGRCCTSVRISIVEVEEDKQIQHSDPSLKARKLSSESLGQLKLNNLVMFKNIDYKQVFVSEFSLSLSYKTYYILNKMIKLHLLYI